MKFENLTPLHAMAFSAIDVADVEFNVVALKAGYRLRKRASSSADEVTHDCVLLEGRHATRLVMADQHEGEAGQSSVIAKSDLAPFKPFCDVVLHATAHAPAGVAASSWMTGLRVWDGEHRVLEKALRVSGPRAFVRGQSGWVVQSPQPAHTVPMRWEYAYGGASKALPAKGDGPPLLNEVCFSNPLGCGWVEKRYLEQALTTSDSLLTSSDVLSGLRHRDRIEDIRAPQIEYADSAVQRLDIVEHPHGELSAKKMAEIAATYHSRPAGLGVVGRPWAPRLARAGTYDHAWLKSVWPYLPADFDFHYWNGAPDDQQIPWPARQVSLELVNLAAPQETFDGRLAVRLPAHRAITVLEYESGQIVPMAMQLDTVFIDAEAMEISLTWRTHFAKWPEVSTCEARFETDPNAPLLRVNEPKVTKQEDMAWQTM
jgi:hypothetical protein